MKRSPLDYLIISLKGMAMGAAVEGVNGPTLKVGSMEEINTNGNWPKNYSQEQ